MMFATYFYPHDYDKFSDKEDSANIMKFTNLWAIDSGDYLYGLTSDVQAM